MKKYIYLSLLVAIFFVGRPLAARAQATGCCINPGNFCISNLSQLQCDNAYATGSAGANFSSGKTCAQVPACAATGKCVKTDGTGCTDLQKWQCDDKYAEGYRFLQGQSCSVTVTPSGTCCVTPPSAGGTIPTCEDNIDAATCRNERLGTPYSTNCFTVGNCPQAHSAAPAVTQSAAPTVKKAPIVFDPEISIPFFSSEAVDGTTFAKYLRAIFITFIWSVGVLATVMVIYGGVRWVAAAGDASRINQAKDVVYNAIIGLVIALTSVVLLNLIDPNLVNFQGLSGTETAQVQGITFQFETDNQVGKFNEGATCRTHNGNKPIQEESACFMTGVKLVWPVGGASHEIKSRVGPRDIKVGSACHPGTDFSTDKVTNKPLLATHDGTIQAVQASKSCGEYTMELHGDTFYTRYVHVKIPSRVNGEKVRAGEVIGYSGGNPADSPAIKSCSGGPHLHIELYSADGTLHDIVPCLQE